MFEHMGAEENVERGRVVSGPPLEIIDHANAESVSREGPSPLGDFKRCRIESGASKLIAAIAPRATKIKEARARLYPEFDQSLYVGRVAMRRTFELGFEQSLQRDGIRDGRRGPLLVGKIVKFRALGCFVRWRSEHDQAGVAAAKRGNEVFALDNLGRFSAAVFTKGAVRTSSRY